LTINDGPGDFTEAILTILDNLDVTATLFVYGNATLEDERLSKCELLQAAASLGLEIESHSFSHRDFATMSDQEIMDDLTDLEEFLVECEITSEVKFFRPPYGSLTLNQAKKIYQEFGYKIAFWNRQFDDGTPAVTQDVLDYIIFQMPGPEMDVSHVILAHEQGIEEALSDAIGLMIAYYIEYYEENGYEFVTLEECWNACNNWQTGIAGRVCKDPGATHPTLDDWWN